MIFSMRRAIYTFLSFLSSKKHQKTVISAFSERAGLQWPTKKELQRCCNSFNCQWCRDQDLNQGHPDFQSGALPTELSRLHQKNGEGTIWKAYFFVKSFLLPLPWLGPACHAMLHGPYQQQTRENRQQAAVETVSTRSSAKKPWRQKAPCCFQRQLLCR